MPISTIGQNGLQQSRILTAVQQPAGAVLQVVSSTYSTQTSTVSTSFVSSGLSASITPTSASSKIMAICSFCVYNSTGGLSSYYTLFKGASNLLNNEGAFRAECSSYTLAYGGISYLDSPATTSSTTYSVYMRSQTAGTTTYIALNNAICSITLMEIAA